METELLRRDRVYAGKHFNLAVVTDIKQILESDLKELRIVPYVAERVLDHGVARYTSGYALLNGGNAKEINSDADYALTRSNLSVPSRSLLEFLTFKSKPIMGEALVIACSPIIGPSAEIVVLKYDREVLRACEAVSKAGEPNLPIRMAF